MTTNLHIIQYPTKRWGYVGNVPSSLGSIVKATPHDVMAGRAWKNDQGRFVTAKFPSFVTKAQAREHARDKGFTAH